MKFHSDDIRKYRKLLTELLYEKAPLDSAMSQRDLNSLFAEINVLLPAFIMSEKAGSKSTEERKEFERLFSSFAGNGNVRERIINIVDKLNTPKDSLDLSQAIQNLILLKTINNMLSSFNAQTIGFMMEALLSALFNGKQVSLNQNTGDTDNNKNDIIDAIFHGKGWSVKTLKNIGSTTSIKGSLELLATALNKYGIVYYLIISKNDKITSPDKLSFYIFEINGDNKSHREILNKYFGIYKTSHGFKNNWIGQFGKSYKQFVDCGLASEDVVAELNLSTFGKDGMSKLYSKYLLDIKNNLAPIYKSLTDFNISLIEYFKKEKEATDLQTSAQQVPITTKTSLTALSKTKLK